LEETVADAMQRIAELSPEKRALLLAQLGREKAAKAKITPRERPAVIPPSFAQQRLWLLDQLEPGSASYNIPFGSWMAGRPDLDVLRRSFDELVRRHESLRTVFPATDGRPRQTVLAPYAVALPVYDVSSSGTAREAALAIARNEAAGPFDLANGPLMRALVVRLSEVEHLLIINVHHIVIDGWSLGVFYRELTAIYEAFLEGRPSPLAEAPLQYIDYALWQREWLQGPVLDKQLAYWTERLAGSPPVLELPSDRPRPARQSHHGNVIRVNLPTDVAEAAKQCSLAEGVTLFMTFFAALQTVLYRYSGQTDIVVGSGIAGRHRAELEPLIGYFVNTLALRTDLSGNPTFRELLGRVKQATLDAYEHQDLPIERLIEELHVERSLGYAPLYQVMVFFQNFADEWMSLAGVSLTALEMDDLHAGTARTDLSLFVVTGDRTMDLLLEYNTDLFDEETVRAFGRHLGTLLGAAATSPGLHINDLPLLTGAERHELLIVRNATRDNVPPVPVQRMIEAQVARTPERTAYVIGDRTLTYAEVNARANAFARELQQHGAKPGTLVGVYTGRGAEMVVAVLAILKTGAAYLPLDPSYPADRIAFMIADSGARLVVTQQHLRNDVPSADATLVLVDASGPVDLTLDNIDGGAGPRDTAYVIFTSGSTGKPKGVQIPHEGALNFFLAMLTAPGLTADDTTCAISTLSFDISTLELILPLLIGAKAAIADRATAADGPRLARFIADSGVTVVQATPASWRMLLDAGWQGSPHLKLLCGGEPLPRDLADALLDRCGELWNVYGPTETTVWSVLDRVTREAPIAVGRAIPNMRMYIADANLQPVPDGVPGELLIGGIGVGHGYINRPGLTAAHFIPDPFSGIAGSRVYRSGDVARWRRDGRIELLGRSDNQIKLRGFRIELGEIEGALRERTDVRQAVVICREDRPGDKRLVAYVVPESGVISTQELRAYLLTVLPDYMVPSAFVVMESLPISPNGKVDRRSLPVPELSDLTSELSAAPRTPEEQQLAAIWCEVLNLPQIGIHDDFFALGGHSLLATQLMSRVSRDLGVDIPLRKLFEQPTVAGLAEVIANERLTSADEDALADLLQRIEGLTDYEIQALLVAKGHA
jgi:amino acid adenylation domain-containing protein